MPVLEVKNLSVQIPTEDGTIYAVQDVSFAVQAGELFGIVGESGSGKSVLVQAIMGLLPNAHVTGEALLDGVDLLTLPSEAMRRLRGASISMIFQDPLSSLHPQYTIGHQVVEQIRVHERISRADAKRRAIEILGKVGITDAEAKFGSYPHQFSGGMRQRVMIAMALVLNPSLIIADEPTTALDSTVQTQILDLMDQMRKEFDAAVLMISHDLGVLARVADSVMVMYAGQKMEFGAKTEIFNRPAHPYAAGLLQSTPANFQPGERLVPIPGRPPSLLQLRPGCVFADRCPHVMDQCKTTPPPLRRFADGGDAYCWLEGEPSRAVESRSNATTVSRREPGEPIIRARDLELSFHSGGLGRRHPTHVLRGVDLTVYKGETLGLVGESGCGKSTLARVVAGLLPASAGSVELAGHDLRHISHAQWRDLRKEVQLVFQDPFGALNPRRRIGSIIGDPLRIHRVGSTDERKRRVKELMDVVGLNPEHYNRFPAEFSGGQRQRVGIARALALQPSVIIYDEPVSALDVSIQAQILNLMDDLQKEFGTTYLLISHDMSVVRHVSDRIAVMDKGEIVEIAATADIYRNPQHALTKALLAASATPTPSTSTGRRQLVSAGDAGERYALER